MTLLTGFEHIIRQDYPLGPLTSLRLGGNAEYFAEPTSVTELASLVARFHEHEVPVRLIGAGSNLLIRSNGVPGLVVHLIAPDFCQIDIDGDTMKCGGGTRLTQFVASAVREGLSGPQQLVGYPGTVGGALHSNAGVPITDIGTWVQSVTVMKRDGTQLTHDRDDMSFSWFQSSIDELVVLSATFKLERAPSDRLSREMQKLWIIRRAAQPPTDENSAYIFRDHGGEPASSLIAAAGLHGTKVGNVEVSDRDPNYFVAQPGATIDEALRLIAVVKTQVAEKLGIDLVPAIKIW